MSNEICSRAIQYSVDELDITPVLSRSTSEGLKSAKERVLSAAARKKISKAVKRRWAKLKAGAKKAVS